LASKVFFDHAFPAPHIDSVESVIDYRVPPEQFSALAAFDGSVIAERTAGRCRRAATTSRPTSWPST
jgi:hypothetical protein